jgi:antitoxin component of MazEF toxin-antitoxin module
MSDLLIRPGKVAQWGNSAAVRLASAALQRAHLSVGDTVQIVARDDEIVIRRQRPQVSLDELLARFDPDNHRRDPVLDDTPMGSETR